jgi:catechol 2,3-dioxygenase-like lactoylglutathione lyase family enzyme
MSNDHVPEVHGFDHAGLSVSNLERSHRFYADVFGFTRVEDDFAMPDHDLRGRVLVNPRASASNCSSSEAHSHAGALTPR